MAPEPVRRFSLGGSAPAFRSPFHIGIASTEMDAVMAALGSLLRLTWVALERPPVVHHTPNGPVCPSPRVSYSAEGPVHVEVLQAEAGTVYDPGDGTHVHHVGYWTHDFAGDLSAAQSEGWSVEVSMRDEAGHPATFAYLTRPGDIRVELVDAVGRSALEALFESVRHGSSSP